MGKFKEIYTTLTELLPYLQDLQENKTTLREIAKENPNLTLYDLNQAYEYAVKFNYIKKENE